MQRPTGGQSAHWESLEYSVLKEWLPSNSFTQGSGNSSEEKIEIFYEPEDLKDTEETRPIKHSRANTPKLTETKTACTGSAPDGVRALREVNY